MAQYAAVLIGASVGLSVVSAVPHTFLLKKYRSLIAEHKEGVEQELDPKLKTITQKVLERVLLPAECEVNVEFFPTVGLETTHKGSCLTHFGTVIGLPMNYRYKTRDDIEKDKIKLKGELIDWESEAGMKLAHSLVLGTKAKAFGITRELYYSYTYYFHVHGALRTAFFLSAYTIYYNCNKYLGLKHRVKPMGRLAFLGVLCTALGFLEVTIGDTYSCFRDNRIDYKTAKLGRDLAEGGVEFYHKELMRNQAMRELLGPEGVKAYTPYGNETATWRTKTVQLTKRRDNLVKYLKDFDKSSENCDICEQISGPQPTSDKDE